MKVINKFNLKNLYDANNKMYYYTMLKAIGVGFIVAIATLFIIGITGAWFYTGQVTENTMNIGNVSISSTSINNPFTYTGVVSNNVTSNVSNLSNTHIVVRAYVNFSWVDGFEIGDVSLLLNNSNWTQGSDGYFYYNFILKPNGQPNNSANFLEAVEINNAPANNIGKNFIVNVYFEAAQYANSAYINLWPTAPGSWASILS